MGARMSVFLPLNVASVNEVFLPLNVASVNEVFLPLNVAPLKKTSSKGTPVKRNRDRTSWLEPQVVLSVPKDVCFETPVHRPAQAYGSEKSYERRCVEAMFVSPQSTSRPSVTRRDGRVIDEIVNWAK